MTNAAGVKCFMCWELVSMRADRGDDRVKSDEGWAHRKCVASPATPEEQLLADIFGAATDQQQRERIGIRKIAEEDGHSVTNGPHPPRGSVNQRERRPWSCSCGVTGVGMTAKERHVRWARRD